MSIRKSLAAVLTFISLAIQTPAMAVTIMPMGDSITTGIDFQTNSQGGYRDPLQTALNSAGISFNFLGVATNKPTAALTAAGNQYHNGYSGWKIDDLQKNLDGSVQASPGDPNLGGYWITGGNGTGRSAQLPDILLLHVGGNDVLQNYDPQTSNPSQAQFIADMGQRLSNLCAAIHTLSPNTVILVASVIPVNTGATAMARVQGVNAYIQNTLVPSLSYTRFVDQYAGFVNGDGTVKTQLLGTDNVHPNSSGYQTMALAWRAAIQAHLGGGGSAPAAPTGLTATGGNAQVSLSWTPSSGAASYNVYRGTAAGGQGASPVASSITGTSYADTGRTNGVTYYYKVAAVNTSGTSGYSNEASATPLAGGTPASPTGLSATAGNAQVSLSWTLSSGATSYNVYRGTSPGGEGASPIVSGLTTGSYVNTGLTNGTAYYYKVAAVNASGTSSYSNEASATPTGGSGGAAFANGSFETPAVGGYTYTPAGSNWTFTNVSGIQRNGSAYSGGAAVAPDGVQTAFVQGVGGSLGAMSQSVNFATAGNYTISFQAARRYGTAQPIRVSVDGVTVGTYTPASDSFASITTASFPVTAGSHTIAFAATDNTADKTSFIDLVSLSGGGGGGAAPAAPTGLTATAGNAQVSLGWTASPGATSYNVYRGTSAGGQSAVPIVTGISGTTYTDGSLTNGTAYHYKVAAVNTSGTSGYSNESSATPTAGGGGGGSAAFANASFETPATGNYVYNPSGATWTFTGNGGVQKNGSAFSGTAAVAPDGVQTAFLQSNGTAGAMAQSVSFSTSGTYTITFKAARRYGSVQPVQVKVDSAVVGTYTPSANSFETITTASFSVTAGSHTVTFTAADATGDKTTFLDAMSIAGGGGGGGSAPAAPTGLAATAGNAQASLNWTASAGAVSYEIYRGTTSNGQSAAPIATGVTGTSHADTGLTNGTTYYYKVKAVNVSGTSAYSNEASATPAAGGSVPAAPTGLAATTGNAQAGLSWTASAGATSYEIYRGTTSDGQSATPIVSGVTGTSFTNTGLTNGTTYYYKVKAVNVSGTSAYSNEASVTPVSGGGGGSASFTNASFETPAVGSYSYTPAGSVWTFTNVAGIQQNGSAYSGTAAVAPDGVQTAFVQGVGGTLGTMSQSVTFSAAGNYTISFQAARRYSTVQPVRVSVDGTVVGTYTPASNSFGPLTTAAFPVTAGSHTITFAATDNTADKSTFIDLVSIEAQ